MKTFILFLFVLITAGCDHSVRKVSVDAYFSMDSLLDAQLISSNGSVRAEKRVLLDGKEEVQSVTFDSSDWANELKIFRDFELNKANYVGAYQVTEGESFTRYDLKKGEKSPVEYLKLELKEESVASIEGEFLEDRAIYQHQRKIKLYLEDKKISHYEVTGFQKMISKDTIKYAITSEVEIVD